MSESSFAIQVKNVVKQIPAGQTMTYKEVAILVGSPHGARAVAQIMARNYDPTVPCHRVVRSDGQLGGYNRGGEQKKRAILQKEGVPFSN